METTSKTMPWNYIDTFGKQPFNNSPGQAHLCQWPLKLKLISSVSPYFHKAHLMLSADCAAFSVNNFHNNLLRNRVLVIGCPEVDSADYAEKLTEIFRSNEILSIAVVRMDAPCCTKLGDAVVEAVRRSKKDIPIRITTSPQLGYSFSMQFGDGFLRIGGYAAAVREVVECLAAVPPREFYEYLS
jgi:hypothetical protein